MEKLPKKQKERLLEKTEEKRGTCRRERGRMAVCLLDILDLVLYNGFRTQHLVKLYIQFQVAAIAVGYMDSSFIGGCAQWKQYKASVWKV
ncbi:hypothetical protein J31TS4_12000 [Paenibacillus sp. J31TS4]|nr:hypothetical protein J31TS4_12000 [Paenibacillus sp. J31TS4]